jgi:phage antirepressor YoqD-like protein
MNKIIYKEHNGKPVVSARNLYAYLMDCNGANVFSFLMLIKTSRFEKDKDLFEVVGSDGLVDYLLTPEIALKVCQGITVIDKAKDAIKVIEVLMKEDAVVQQEEEDTTMIDLSTAAKVVGVGPNKLFEFLRTSRILTFKNTPYQNYIAGGFFKVKIKNYKDGAGISRSYPQTFVTQSGLDFLFKIVEKYKCVTSHA